MRYIRRFDCYRCYHRGRQLLLVATPTPLMKQIPPIVVEVVLKIAAASNLFLQYNLIFMMDGCRDSAIRRVLND